MVNDVLTMTELRRLCGKYVPRQSRHENSFERRISWWHAHEIGHLLVALPKELRAPLFGFADVFDELPSKRREWYAMLTECAAMTVGEKLMAACGRRDLADEERKDTDWRTMLWWESHARAVRTFCKARGVARIPRTISGLEAMIVRKLQEGR